MTKEQKTKPGKPIRQWVEINRYFNIYRNSTFILLGLTFLLSSSILVLINGDPVVVIIENGKRVSYQGEKRPLKITEEDLKEAITNYVKTIYEWDSFDPHAIVTKIGPYVTEGYREKLFSTLGRMKHQNKQGESISQYVANVKVSITKTNLLASFSKVILLNGQPLATNAELSVQLVDGPKTKANPLGLYINGIVEHGNE